MFYYLFSFEFDVCFSTQIFFAGEVGKHLKVIFGGGRRHFKDRTQVDEEGNMGHRTDGKDLITEWINGRKENEERAYVWNKVRFFVLFDAYLYLLLKCTLFLFLQQGLLSIQPSANQSVLGLFAPSHCEYNHLIDGISDTAPTLKEMTMKAIEILQTNPNGFFLFVEGGRIDHALVRFLNQLHVL